MKDREEEEKKTNQKLFIDFRWEFIDVVIVKSNLWPVHK